MRFTSILIALSLPLVSCKKSEQELIIEDQTRVAAEVEKLLTSDASVTLYSLDPNPGTGQTDTEDQDFCGFRILGKTELTDSNEKNQLIKSFVQGIRESDGSMAICFSPRHGVKIVSEGRTSVFVICFHCLSVLPQGFNSDRRFLTSNSARDVFDAFLDEYHLPKASKLPTAPSE